ncbi:MAG TPA: hypothetical protein VFK43_12335 [Acidimicrobiales bacterium]|nr:hypothetical protein [Acidimicrobiales bacterium]
MCGGCNVLAEGAGASVIFARYWWVARQGRRAVVEAERIAAGATTPVPDRSDDPMVDLTRVT